MAKNDGVKPSGKSLSARGKGAGGKSKLERAATTGPDARRVRELAEAFVELEKEYSDCLVALGPKVAERDELAQFVRSQKALCDKKQVELSNAEINLEGDSQKHISELVEVSSALRSLRLELLTKASEFQMSCASNVSKTSVELSGNSGEVASSRLKLVDRLLESNNGEFSDWQKSVLAKLDHDQDLLLLRNKYELDLAGLYSRFNASRKDKLRKAFQYVQQVVTNIETSISSDIDEKLKAHARELEALRGYFNELFSASTETIKELKSEHATLLRKENADSKAIAELVSRNKGLVEPLKKVDEDIESVKSEIARNDSTAATIAQLKEDARVKSRLVKQLEFESEVLEQKIDHANKQKAKVLSAFQSSVDDISKKAVFKSVVLANKLEFLSTSLLARIPETISSSGIVDSQIGSAKGRVEQLRKSLLRAKEEYQRECDLLERVSDGPIDLLAKTAPKAAC